MFNKQPTKPEPPLKNAEPPTEEFTFSFFGLKFNVKNPGWKTVIMGIVFLVVVVIIVFLING
jgi:hypothetical protein